MKRIGFVGLGNMGLPMAANLACKGFQVRGFDKDPNAVERAKKKGLPVGPSVSEVCLKTDIVITVLNDDEAVRSVVADVLDSMENRPVIVDCSTISVDCARQLHDIAGKAGCSFLDAPVSGAIPGAEAGTLTFIVGGPETVVESVRPAFEAMGSRIVHCGGPGAGQATKICNNMLLATSMIAVSEAMSLGGKLGLDPQRLFDTLSTSTGACWALENYNPLPGLGRQSPADANYQPGFATTMMIKDMSLSQACADTTGQATPLAARSLELYREFAQAGGAALDFSAIIKHLEVIKRQ